VTFSPELSIDLSQDQIQPIPIRAFRPRSACWLLCALNCANPRSDSKKARIASPFRAVPRNGNRHLHAFMGGPRHVQGAGTFHLEDIQVSELQMSGNAPDFDEAVRTRGPKVMAEVLQRVSLYSLNSNSKHGAMAKHALRSVRVVEGKLRITFLNRFGRFGKDEAMRTKAASTSAALTSTP
jgi:hypothetical protein